MLASNSAFTISLSTLFLLPQAVYLAFAPQAERIAILFVRCFAR